jgi:hypothetical protein
MGVTDFIKGHKASLSLYSLNLGTSVVEIASGHPEMVSVSAPMLGVPTIATFAAEKYLQRKKMKKAGI